MHVRGQDDRGGRRLPLLPDEGRTYQELGCSGGKRCRANGFPGNDKPCKAILWPDAARPHDVFLMDKVREYLPLCDTKGLDLEVLSPTEATRVTCKRAKEGLNAITVTGNVLRDYLTDLFPILVLGVSAKMLSVAPGLAGGDMYAPSLCPFRCVRARCACVGGGSGVSLSLSVSASAPVSVSVTGTTTLGEIGRFRRCRCTQRGSGTQGALDDRRHGPRAQGRERGRPPDVLPGQGPAPARRGPCLRSRRTSAPRRPT